MWDACARDGGGRPPYGVLARVAAVVWTGGHGLPVAGGLALAASSLGSGAWVCRVGGGVRRGRHRWIHLSDAPLAPPARLRSVAARRRWRSSRRITPSAWCPGCAAHESVRPEAAPGSKLAVPPGEPARRAAARVRAVPLLPAARASVYVQQTADLPAGRSATCSCARTTRSPLARHPCADADSGLAHRSCASSDKRTPESRQRVAALRLNPPPERALVKFFTNTRFPALTPPRGPPYDRSAMVALHVASFAPAPQVSAKLLACNAFRHSPAAFFRSKNRCKTDSPL